MLNTAVEWGMLYSNPCDCTKTPKAETKEAKYIDEEQNETLMKILDNETDEMKRNFIRILL